MKGIAGFSLLLSGVLAFPAGAGAALALNTPLEGSQGPSTPELLARGGGRGGGGSRGGGGANRGGGNRGGGGGNRARTGMSGGGASLNRGNSRPSGGWSNRVSSPSARPSIQRPSGSNNIGRGNINTSGNRNISRDGNRSINRDVNRNVNRDVNRNFNRNVNWDANRRVNINNVNVNAGWARPGWGVARPWNAGWYGGWSSPTWGWWGARAATWGVASLATAAIINSAVDNAVSNNTTYIMVPNTDYQLLYGSIQPSGSQGVNFAVTADGSTYQLSADCNRGLLDGREPSTSAEAELLNAACQVAFGSV